MNTKLNRIKSALRESIEIARKATEGPWEVDKAVTWDRSIAVQPCIFQRNAWTSDEDAAFVCHARTMTPLACKALLTAIERLELGLKCQDKNEGLWAFSFNTLESITSEWPDV